MLLEALLKVIENSDEINKVVLSSSIDEEFLRSKFLFSLYLSRRHTDRDVDYLSLRRMINGTIKPSLQYSLVGSPSWCYSTIIKPESMHTAPSVSLQSNPGLCHHFPPIRGIYGQIDQSNDYL